MTPPRTSASDRSPRTESGRDRSTGAERERPEGGQPPSPGPRTHLTSRAAILAIVVCAIALSLAYPIREYIAQRREISQLREQKRIAQQRVDQLAKRKRRLGEESYIRREARRRLHYCDPGERCYVVLGGGGGGQGATTAKTRESPPWYVNLWRSVEAADHVAAR